MFNKTLTQVKEDQAADKNKLAQSAEQMKHLQEM